MSSEYRFWLSSSRASLKKRELFLGISRCAGRRALISFLIQSFQEVFGGRFFFFVYRLVGEASRGVCFWDWTFWGICWDNQLGYLQCFRDTYDRSHHISIFRTISLWVTDEKRRRVPRTTRSGYATQPDSREQLAPAVCHTLQFGLCRIK
jgi:hypothetical protein